MSKNRSNVQIVGTKEMLDFKEMRLNEGFLIQIGDHRGWVFGGPYRNYKEGVRRLASVKMAVEIDADADVSIPTKDFGVPTVSGMQIGLIKALYWVVSGNDLYVGCMGGTGRTGLFMACLIKSLQDAGHWLYDEDPIESVRTLYRPHAVETQEQEQWVRNFDTKPVVKYILSVAPHKEESKPTLWETVVQAVKRFLPLS